MGSHYSPSVSSTALPRNSSQTQFTPISQSGPSSVRRSSNRYTSSVVNGGAPTGPLHSSSDLSIPHRALHLSPRQNSGMSISGASSPARRRKVLGNGVKDGDADRDWAGMEPDDIFRKLPVGEVKKVEAKMRGDAMNKQSELRSMVGTRYRDLLTSATQITSLHSSSLRLSSSLKTVAQACTDPLDVPAGETDSADPTSDVEDAMSMLPVAAHMKLLLDAPEILYSQLSHHSHLKAAYLWLLTRVVREGLTSMPEEVSSPYLPLMQKQWETLLPFRGQIVHRATLALRGRDKMDAKVLSDTLLSIILLDALPLADALSLFLSQRTKALRDLLSHHERDTNSAAHLSPTSAKKGRRNSRISSANAAREAAHDRDAVGNILIEAVKCLLETVTLAKAVLERRRRITREESLIEEMIRLVQEGEPLPVSPATPMANRNSHQRRASRLVSISHPLPRMNSSSGSTVTTTKVLQTLPSSQILLRYLPASITAFTPFITPSQPPALDEVLKTWQTSSIDLLKEAVPSWLSSLGSVNDVWHVRASMKSLLPGSSELEREIRDGLESGWEGRVRAVWEMRLNEILRSAETGVRAGGEEIRQKRDQLDTDPSSFLFSDINFPSAPASSFTSILTTSSSFATFLKTLEKRSKSRTPLLDDVLTNLEESAKNLRADLNGLPSNLYLNYAEKVTDMLTGLVKVLEKVLDSMGPSRGDGKEVVESELFVGRVALYLSGKEGFLTDIVGEAKVDLDPTIASLIAVHATSTIRWKERSIQGALAELAPLFEIHRGPREIQSTWQGPYPTQPSPPIMTALYSLVSSTRQLGLPPGTKLPVIENLVKAFVDAVRGLEGWKLQKDQAILQAIVDLGFLGLLKGDKLGEDEVVQKLIAEIPKDSPSEFLTSLPSILLDSLRRTQILLHPLTLHLSASDVTSAGGSGGTKSVLASADRNAALLRFGSAGSGSRAGGSGSEFRSPIAVAKPGKRFGLLSVVA